MEIRRPSPDDARQVRAAWARAWRAGHREVVSEEVLSEIQLDPSPDAVQRWHDRLDTWRDSILVADDDGVVGFIQIRLEETKPFVSDDEADLKELYVHPDRWGEGVGTALLEAGLDRLPADVAAVRLERLSGNERAAAFYEDRGFERTGDHTVDIGGEQYPADVYTRRLDG